ncbi:MAG: LysR family transcriptional regulator [Verrucomicrobia bacterium]|nr:MAG: LysR family transcriptional regulator [Verrucomicrobiota bacterium]
MNIHHLELFYFVAKHGGIAAAVRNIPYGIQQPAVSGQIAKLEESLGTKLFQRRPFALSPAGMELFEFIKPFFDNVEIVGEKLRQNRSPQLRIAAPSIVLHDYIPELLQKLRTKFPEFRLYLHEAARAEAERLLLARDIDLAITFARAEELWKRDKIEETLISFPRTDPIHASFQRGLEHLGVEWFCGIEVNSARLIERYVASGYGIGLAVAVPGFRPAQEVRVLQLPDFPPVVVGASWSGKLSNISKQLLTELETEAQVQVRRMKSGARG